MPPTATNLPPPTAERVSRNGFKGIFLICFHFTPSTEVETSVPV